MLTIKKQTNDAIGLSFYNVYIRALAGYDLNIVFLARCLRFFALRRYFALYDAIAF